MASSPPKDRSCQLTIALGLVLLGLSAVLMPELWRGAAFVVTRMVYNVFAEPPNCRKGTCIRIELQPSAGTPQAPPAAPGQTDAGVGHLSTVALSIDSPVDVSDLSVLLSTTHPTVVLIEGQREWKVNIKSHQRLTLTSEVRFTHEGYYSLIGEVVTKDGGRPAISMGVHVTAGGITPNPTVPGAGTHEPIPATIIFGASPFPTDTPTSTIPPPTPTRPPYP